MTIFKKTLNVLGAVIGIPLLLYSLLYIANFIILYFFITVEKISNISYLNEVLINTAYIGTLIGEGLTVFILFIIFIFIPKNLIKRCNFKEINSKKLPVIICLTIGLSLFSMLFVILGQNFFPSYQTVENTMNAAKNSYIEMLVVLLIGPIFEEIIFRGAIFSILRKNIPLVPAIIIQAILFGLLHGNPLQGIYAFFLGIVLCLIYLYTGSILGNMLCHIIFNILGSVILPIVFAIFPNILIMTILGIIFLFLAYHFYKKEHLYKIQ